MADSRVTRINAAMDAAIAAQEAGDYATALAKARTAWMLISGLPNSMFDNEQLQWQPTAVESVMKELQRLANQAASSATGDGGIIRPVPIVYTRETPIRDC